MNALPTLFRTRSLQLIAVLLVFTASRARASIGPDDAAAALASVVESRAKLVAAQTIADEFSGSLCGKSVDIADSGDGLKRLCFGGNRVACVKAQSDADDVFVASCHLIKGVGLDLVDPHVLKTVSSDAIALLLRLAAYKLNASQYTAAHLPDFATFIADSTAVLSQPNADDSALLVPIQSLADKLQTGLPVAVLSSLATSPAVAALSSKVVSVLKSSCAPPHDTTPICVEIAAHPTRWFPPVGSPQAFVDSNQDRLKFFDSLFDAGKDYGNARNLPCELADLKQGFEYGCRQAQVLVNLNDILQNMLAMRAPGHPPQMTMVRELTYILLEAQRHAASLKVLNGGASVPEFDAFISAARPALDPSLIARQELATGVDLIAAIVAAQKVDSKALSDYLTTLDQQILVIAQASKLPSTLFAYKDAPELSSRVVVSKSIKRVRDDLKTMNALPLLGVESSAGTDEILVLVHELVDVQISPGTGLHRLASYVRVLADALAKIGGAGMAPISNALVDAVRQLADALDLAGQRDWVGIAITLTDDLESCGGLKDASVKRSMTFVRILLTSYQAKSVDEAKAIFSSGLESIGSRRERFSGGAIDVAALVGARAGYEATFSQNGVVTSSRLYGLFAPFGVQLSDSHVGFLVYPIDLGAYLTTTTNGTTVVHWQDSVRFGGSLYARPSAEVPVVLGAAADLAPTTSDRIGSWRVFGMVALELPLFLIY